MLCEEVKPLFSIYADDEVTQAVGVEIEEHLEHCPVCRSQVADLRLLRQSLRSLARPLVPADLADTITEALAIEAGARRIQPILSMRVRVGRWLEPKLMPYTIGSFASVILFIAMFAALRPHFVALHEAALQSTANRSMIYRVEPRSVLDLNEPVRSEDYAASRAPFAEQSPSLNPRGALAALTQSYTRPAARTESYDEDGDDMVVVADVFSNGSASLAGVVQAPRDRRMLAEFESALRQDAAFVPASFDRRPDTMRVVFSVQKVDVRERNF